MTWSRRVVVASVTPVLMIGAATIGAAPASTAPVIAPSASHVIANRVTIPRAATSLPAYHPLRLTHVGAARQVIVVTTTSWSQTTATLRAYRRLAHGMWRLSYGPWFARVGRTGMAPAANRLQNTGKTPSGTFTMRWAFGRYGDPGTRMPYRKLTSAPWWPYDRRDPKTYNVFQRQRVSGAYWRTGSQYSEHLVRYVHTYQYAVVLDFNRASGPITIVGGQRVSGHPADVRRGGGIFLHVDSGRPTAGCVAVSLSHMRRLLRWLNPSMHSVIVIAPTSALPTA